MTTSERATIDYKSEILRKLVHLCSLSIPVGYYFLTKETTLSILFPMALFSLMIDYGRYYSKPLQTFIDNIFGFMMRNHEKDSKKKNLSGATYVLISAVLVIFLFPKIFAIAGFAVLIVGDMAAALIGRRFGRTKFLFKSLEGTLAFFVFSCAVILFTPKISGSFYEYLIGFIAVGIGALAENISGSWADDNVTIPVSIGIVMWLLYSLWLPDLNLVLPYVPN